MNIPVRKWLYFQEIDSKYQILMVLAALHVQGMISDEKLKGQFMSLRAGTLQRRKGTYHCTINDRWYNDESAMEVFEDLAVFLKYPSIKLDDLVKYIARFENKGYNYGINILLSEYIRPLVYRWNPEYHGEDFLGWIGLDLPLSIKARVYRSECDYCGSGSTTYHKNERDIEESLSKYFHSLKKGNLKKIPFHNI